MYILSSIHQQQSFYTKPGGNKNSTPLLLLLLVFIFASGKATLARIHNKKVMPFVTMCRKHVWMECSNLSVEKSFQTSLAVGVDHVQSHDTICQVFDVHLWALHSKNMLHEPKEDRRKRQTAKETRQLTQVITMPPT